MPTPALRILIKHPGYHDFHPDSELWGCSHRVVLDACRIIASNRDGFLSPTPERRDQVTDSDLTLVADVYYYLIANSDETDYPVVVQVATWRFPVMLPDY